MKRQTFIVEITETADQNWQGQVNWIQGQDTKMFRSLMELLRLIDSAVEDAPEIQEEQLSISG